MVYVSVIVIVCDGSLVQSNDDGWISETFERIYLNIIVINNELKLC